MIWWAEVGVLALKELGLYSGPGPVIMEHPSAAGTIPLLRSFRNAVSTKNISGEYSPMYIDVEDPTNESRFLPVSSTSRFFWLNQVDTWPLWQTRTSHMLVISIIVSLCHLIGVGEAISNTLTFMVVITAKTEVLDRRSGCGIVSRIWQSGL